MTIHFDARAGLAARPYTVQIAGRVYSIPAAPAAVWLDAWADYGASGVLIGLVTDPIARYRITAAVLNGETTGDQVAEASRRLWAAAAGVPWWTGERIAMYSVSWSGAGGEMWTQGLRPDAVPLAAWLACAYRFVVACTKKDNLPALEASLTLPPAGYDTGELPASIGEFFTP